MMNTGYDLFISYRRDGGVDYARMIYLELKGRGYNTFFDYNSLRDGKFNEGIFKAIDECRYFILVLSSGSLDRCMSEDDWVRHEIEYALSKNKAIIPVCPSGSMRGFPAKMPESFEPLRNLQISMLQMDDLFEKSFDKIVEDRFDAEFREGRAPIPVSGGVTSKVFKRIGIGVIAAIIAAAGIIGVSMIRSREAEKARAEQSRQLTEKMLTQAAEEKKAADAAREKARQDAIAAQKEHARIEAEMWAKEKAEAEAKALALKEEAARKERDEIARKEKEKREAELRAANEERLRLAAEAQAKEKAAAELKAAQEEKMRLEAEAKAKEKAAAELQAVQKEKMQLEAEMKAKEKSEAELQAARDAKIRAEAEANAAKASGGGRQESDAVKKLVLRESEIKAKLIPAETELASLKKEIDRLEHASIYSVLTGDAAKREEEDNRRAARRAREKMTVLEKDVTNWKEELSVVQESVARTRAIDSTYHGASNGEVSTEKLDEMKSELDKLVKRVVARRIKVKALGGAIPEASLSSAEQLYEVFSAEKGSLVDALQKCKEADAAYGEILDKVIENKISQLEFSLNSAPEHSKWHSALKVLKELTSIDPENERLKKAVTDAAGHVSPSMTVTAELDGVEVPDVQFFANGNPVASPYHHVFETGNRNLSGDLRFLDAVYTKDGVVYAARRYGSSHNWLGETNIVLKLKPTPKAGTEVRVKLGRLSQSTRNWSVSSERNLDQETYIDLVWCPPGTDVVKFIDPGSDTEKSVVRTVNVGFWIARYEMTGHQFHTIINEEKASRSMTWFGDKQPTDDTPVRASYMTLSNAFRSNSQIDARFYGCLIFSDYALLSIPDVDQWVRAARFGGFAPTEAEFGEYAWAIENAGTNTAFKVGQKKPNALGLYDVYGNVPEWVEGSAYVWLGLHKPDSNRDGDLISKMGGGCNDDFESATDILSQRPLHGSIGEGQGKAGLRLMARSLFQHEKSLLDWVRVCDLLDSEDERARKEGMDLLAKYAKESDDLVLQDVSAMDYIARGGDPQDIGLPMTKLVKLELIRRTSDSAALTKYVLEDEDESVRKVAFEKIEDPPSELVVKYMCGLRNVYEECRHSKKVNEALFYMFERDSKITPELLEMIALKAKCPNFRSEAIKRITNQDVLKDVALNDTVAGNVYSAIERIKRRSVLLEIKERTKYKGVKAAVRDRLEELSE